ncbi:MAG: phosphoenolpyruvate carboxykinase (GTP) [Candidatus Micrarchaeaceae archaeon]
MGVLDEKIEKELRGISDSLYEKVAEFASIMEPISVVLIKGTKEEYNKLVSELLGSHELIKLNEKEYPNSYLYRSDRNDVARSEESTYICTKSREEVGPTNNWADEDEMESRLKRLLKGIMKGKTMYILPYLLGPAGSQFASCGVELTDSKYVAISQMIIANVGDEAIECIKLGDFVFGIQATGNLDPANKYIAHFPNKRLIITVNSAYGGNALLSKKCHALRIESYRARGKEMLIEHMMAIEVTDPEGRSYGITGAFPSASGKTNLAMISPPPDYKGWRVKLLSDDISWFRIIGGELRATNPEYGFFGVVPGTNEHTNSNAMKTIKSNTIFTNVALDPKDNTPWWEGLSEKMPSGILDWQGNANFNGPAAHPNSRFTTPISQYPNLSSSYGSPTGLKIHAMLFGGRRISLVPLVYEAYSLEHGVLIGAMLRAETTAAVAGKVGVVRNDPMAMRPFCGYNMAEYFDHFYKVLSKLERKPKIFNVNWFMKDDSGRFLWPGFSDNMRVIRWITERIDGRAEAIESPIGLLPSKESFDRGGVSEADMEKLLYVDKKGWIKELDEVKPFFESFGERFPKWLWNEYYKLRERIESW